MSLKAREALCNRLWALQCQLTRIRADLLENMSADEHFRFTTLWPLPPQDEWEVRDLGPPVEKIIEEMRGVEMWGGQGTDSSLSWSEPMDIDEARDWGGGRDSYVRMAVDSGQAVEGDNRGSGADVGFYPDDRMAVDGEPHIENRSSHSQDEAQQMDLLEDMNDEDMKDGGKDNVDEDSDMDMGLDYSDFSSSSGSEPPTADTTPLLTPVTSTDRFTPKVDLSASRQPTSAEMLLDFERAYAVLYKSGVAVARNRRYREQRLSTGFSLRKFKTPVGLSRLRGEVNVDQVMDWTDDVPWGWWCERGLVRSW